MLNLGSIQAGKLALQLLQVLIGQLSWVAPAQTETSASVGLGKLRRSVLWNGSCAVYSLDEGALS